MEMKRLGLIVPSSNTVMERDIYQRLPENISLHTSRMYMTETTPAGEARMLDKFFPLALKELASLHPHAIIFGCTSAGALRGNEHDAQLCREISAQAGCPAISVIHSACQQVLRSNIRRLAVLTPYIEELNEKICASFSEYGVAVCKSWGLGIEDNFTIASIHPEEIIAFARREMQGVSADGLFISCTNFLAIEARQRLEEELGLPVYTSNQVALQFALELLA